MLVSMTTTRIVHIRMSGLSLTGNGRLTMPTNLIAILTAGGKEETMKKYKNRIEDGTVLGEVPPLGL